MPLTSSCFCITAYLFPKTGKSTLWTPLSMVLRRFGLKGRLKRGGRTSRLSPISRDGRRLSHSLRIDHQDDGATHVALLPEAVQSRPGGARTRYLRIKSGLLYLLSYRPAT